MKLSIRHILSAYFALALLSLAGKLCLAETVVLDSADQWVAIQENSPAEFAEIRAKLEADRARQAQKQIERWIKDNEGSAYMDQALHLNAQVLMARGKHYDAYELYEQLLDEYPNSQLFDTALRQEVEIARVYLAGQKRTVLGFLRVTARAEAVTMLDGVIERWPGSELSCQALMMQADYYFGEQRYVESQQIYQTVVEHYSHSDYYPTAMLRSADSSFNQYFGPDYDATCLDDAYIRYLQFEESFPERARQNNIQERLEQIIDEKIQKEFEIADFYRRTNKTDSAVSYWEMIAARWPESQWAEQSRELLELYADNTN